MTVEDLLQEAVVSRIAELEGKILQARHSYYNETPTVPDETYDAWVDELAELKADSPAVTAVGASPVSEWKKVAHGIPMGSLDKVNTLEEFTTWVVKVAAGGDVKAAMGIMLLVTEKLDGISIHVEYQDGCFVRGVTRGDGSIGEDISANVARMKGVPARLPESFTGSLRGEVVILKSDFAQHFKDKANTRNAASGTAKRYDGAGCEHLTVMFYKVPEGRDFETEAAQFEWLESMGLKVPNWYATAMMPGAKTPQDIWAEYQQTKRAELDYDIDGLVISLDNLTAQLALGEQDSRPLGSIAFKFAPITRETILRRIDWQVGGSGRLTPVAEFDPVNILGATITNASLYNLKYIQDLAIDIGSRIIVARANDVIPRVVSRSSALATVAKAPEACPVCGAPTVREGEYVVCSDTAGCPAQLVGRVKRWIKGLDIKEWGDTIIERLVDAGLVKDVTDLYRLTVSEVGSIERMGAKSAQTLIDNLHEKNPVPLETLLGSLSIPMIGSSMVEKAMDAGYTSWAKFQAASLTDITAIPDFGPAKAKALHDWINHPAGTGKYIMRVLGEVGLKVKGRIVGGLTGQSFCFTGTMKNKRADLEELVKANGGTVKDRVGKGLSFLVIADPKSTTSKAQAARKNGTRCISEEDFLQMVTPA
jgi:DNA ligase (NAD+)